MFALFLSLSPSHPLSLSHSLTLSSFALSDTVFLFCPQKKRATCLSFLSPPLSLPTVSVSLSLPPSLSVSLPPSLSLWSFDVLITSSQQNNTFQKETSSSLLTVTCFFFIFHLKNFFEDWESNVFSLWRFLLCNCFWNFLAIEYLFYLKKGY